MMWCVCLSMGGEEGQPFSAPLCFHRLSCMHLSLPGGQPPCSHKQEGSCQHLDENGHTPALQGPGQCGACGSGSCLAARCPLKLHWLGCWCGTASVTVAAAVTHGASVPQMESLICGSLGLGVKKNLHEDALVLHAIMATTYPLCSDATAELPADCELSVTSGSTRCGETDQLAAASGSLLICRFS